MEILEAIHELYSYASVPKIHSLDKLLEFAEPSLDPEAIRKGLLEDRRFIAISDKQSGEELFVLDTILFQWFIRLNIRLSRILQFKISDKQIAFLLSMLRDTGRFSSPPAVIIKWGQRLGLICQCRANDHYVFPLAKILSAMNKDSAGILSEMLNNLFDNQTWNLPLRRRIDKCIKLGFSKFGPNIEQIVSCRAALTEGRKSTLQELGNLFGLTRERIRQLEENFWVSIGHGYTTSRPFLEAFLCDYMSSAGSLIVDHKSKNAPLRMFLTKCAGLPNYKFPTIGLVTIAARPEENAIMRSLKGLNLIVDEKTLAERLDLRADVSYSREDIKVISERIARHNRKRLSTYQRVYLTLSSIGKPAHYSAIAEVHNSMWPDHISSEHYIHAALSKQKIGIVWIGLKGTYALKEWGYQRPSKTLFSTVADIVKSKYQETGKPVHANLITAELGKHRRLVNPQSLVIALMCNPLVKRARKDMYLPSDQTEEKRKELDLEGLDTSLEKFQKYNKNI